MPWNNCTKARGSGVASPIFWRGNKYYDFKRAKIFCLGQRLTKHKTTRYATNLVETIGPLAPPCYACCWWKATSAFVLAVALQIKLSLSSKLSRKLGSRLAKDVCTCFLYLERVYDRVPQEKVRGVLREYGTVDHLLLVVKPLYSCSRPSVRVSGVKITTVVPSCWNPTRVWAVTTPLRNLQYMHSIDSHSRVNEGITSRNCRINRLRFTDDLVMFSSSEQRLQHALGRFSAVCDLARMKISMKKTELLQYVSPQTQASAHCK